MSFKTKKYSFCLFRIPEKGGRIIWEITNTCNYSCSYCIFSSDYHQKPNELGTEEVKRVLNELWEANFRYIKFTGGEPFMRKDFLDILQYAYDKGFELDISTNASFINEETLIKLKEIKIPMVHVSLDGPNTETQELVRGKGTFKRTLEGIEKLTREGLHVRIGTVIFKENQDQLEEIARLCCALNAKELLFSRMEPVGRMRGDESHVTTYSNEKLIEKIEFLEKKYASQIEIQHRFSENSPAGCGQCPGGDKFLYIDHKGRVSPCTWVSEFFPQYVDEKTLHKMSLSNLLEEKAMKHYKKLTGNLKTLGCPAKFPKEIKKIEALEGIFKDMENTVKNGPRFSKYSALYAFTTENIADYYTHLDFENKDILMIGGSGDHLVNAYLLGAKSIVCCDSNQLAEFYVNLKIEALKKLNFNDFKKFFLRNNEEKSNVFSYTIYKELRSDLTASSRYFFDHIYKKFNFDGQKIRESYLFNNKYDLSIKKIRYNLYLKNEKRYQKTQKMLLDKKMEWIAHPIESVVQNRLMLLKDRQFDIILLSNIADYSSAHDPQGDYLTEFKKKIIDPLSQRLKPKGILALAYLYKTDFTSSRLHSGLYRSAIDNPLERKRVFKASTSDTYKEMTFKSAIRGKDSLFCLIKN